MKGGVSLVRKAIKTLEAEELKEKKTEQVKKLPKGKKKSRSSKEEDLIKSLMKILSAEKQEGETVPDFERKVKEESSRVLELEL